MPKVLIDGKNCFYQDLGKGYPVLFGHSYLWNSHMWEPQLQQLSKEFRCIAVDLWNHGQSSSLSSDSYSIERLASDYWKLMTHLGFSEFAVVGLSVGGMWGTQLALDHPEAISALVLMDTYVGTEPPVTQQKYFKLLNIIEKERGFSDSMLDQILPLFFSPYTFSHQPQLVQNFRNALKSIEKEVIPGIVTLGRAIFTRTSLLHRLPSLTQPVLVAVGKDDIPRPPKEAKEMAESFPNGELHVIENAGHICNLEQPELVTSLLAHFLKSATRAQLISTK